MLRLGWEDKITEYLPVQHFLPAVGQGALVVEARLNDKEMVELVPPLNHLPTWQSTIAERAFLSITAIGLPQTGHIILARNRARIFFPCFPGRALLRLSHQKR